MSDLLVSGIVSGKGSLQGGLLALEFGYKAMYLQAPGDSTIVDAQTKAICFYKRSFYSLLSTEI